MQNIQIWHNPKCSKSRAAMELLENKNIDANVVEYLKQIPTKEQIKDVLKKLRISAKELLRTSEDIYKELNLNQIDDDDQSEIVINNFKEKYPNSTTYSLRFIAEDIEAPIVSTMARKFPESRLHVLHVSTVPTQDGTYAKMTLQVIGSEDLQKAVREHLDSTYNVTMEVI